MKNTAPEPSPDESQPTAPCHASFIVRCWIGQEQQMRIRLIDVNSGISHPVANLDNLPKLLISLLENLGT